MAFRIFHNIILNILQTADEADRIEKITKFIEFGFLDLIVKLFYTRNDFEFAFLKTNAILFQNPRDFLKSTENRKMILRKFEEFETIEKINQYGFLQNMANNFANILRGES